MYLAMSFAQLTCREIPRDNEASPGSQRQIPTFIGLRDGKVAEVTMPDEILPEAGSFGVMDRGDVDFQRL